MNEIERRTKDAFYDIKNESGWAHKYVASRGFTLPTGEVVCCFWKEGTTREVCVYLDAKGVLRPYFGEERSDS